MYAAGPAKDSSMKQLTQGKATDTYNELGCMHAVSVCIVVRDGMKSVWK